MWHLFLWGFDSSTGELFLDARVEIKNQDATEVEQASGLFLRQRFNPNLTASLIGTSSFDNLERYVSFYNETREEEVLTKFRSAKVTERMILRKKEESNALDFILHMED